MGPDGPKWGQEVFFLPIQTLPTFWAERILILRIFIFGILLGPKFLAWAQLGPTHLGPPTWARLGPTHLGPAWAHPLGPGLPEGPPGPPEGPPGPPEGPPGRAEGPPARPKAGPRRAQAGPEPEIWDPKTSKK